MARLARIVVPGVPHFVTQRGNRGEDVFFCESDAQAYVDFLSEQAQRFGLSVWAYCLMPNRVHILAVPEQEDSLSRTFGETHRRYTNLVNTREGWTGHLWQSRFSSFPIEENFVLPAAHFIEMTPVMAGVCKTPSAFRWSSARAHLKGETDGLCNVAPLLERAPDWDAFLRRGLNISRMQTLSRHITTGRPLGGTAFVETLEQATGRALKKKRPGRKPAKMAANG